MIACLSILIATWGWWLFRSGYLLYYGDAQAHLNISRSMLDSRTPGYDQLGTVWLPVLHVLCLPLVGNTGRWSTGLAGGIPVALCFVAAGTLLYLAVRNLHGAIAPAVVSLACFALNPNLLYLGSIPMTEVVFLAGLALLLYAGILYRDSNNPVSLALAIVASNWMSLTRYDGWFLIPFAALWLASADRTHRLRTGLLFLCLASLGPLYWIAHSWWQTANPLDFYNGPYSALSIQKGRTYPGFHDWPNAFLYYAAAARLCSGAGLVLLAGLGFFVSLRRRLFVPTCLLLLPCAFYIWSIHSSGNPIHVPGLWPNSYYNTRYGIAFTFFAAFAAGALARGRTAWFIPCLIPAIAVLPWLISPAREHWICWKESVVNSDARRAWTAAGAGYLAAHYREGEGILAPFGDVAGIFCRAGIPLRQVVHEGNGPLWFATLTRPDLVHTQRWAMAQAGDRLDQALAGPHGTAYHLEQQIRVPGSPALNIYQRNF